MEVAVYVVLQISTMAGTFAIHAAETDKDLARIEHKLSTKYRLEIWKWHGGHHRYEFLRWRAADN